MPLSFSAFNAILEQECEKNPEYRAKLKKNGKWLLSDFRAMSDEEILAGFHKVGIPLDRSRLDELTRRETSAEWLSRRLIEALPDEIDDEYDDWAWMGLACLWERWVPHRPSMEMIDGWMQEGYRFQKAKQYDEALRLWRQTWTATLDMCRDCGITSIREFDEAFGGTNCLFNWIQDFVMELANATYRDTRFAEERIRVCSDALLLVRGTHRDLERQFRKDIAEAYADLGDAARMDQEFSELVVDYPDWPWGWLSWAQVWGGEFQSGVPADYPKAESILLAGISAASDGARELQDQLADLRAFCGDQLPQNPVAVRLRPAPRRAPFPISETLSSAIDERPRVGRNDPCPCGSGRKFKKCCGAR